MAQSLSLPLRLQRSGSSSPPGFGLITKTTTLNRPPKRGKPIELTDAGRSELGAHAEAIERIWQRAGRWREWGCRMGPDTIEVASAVGRLTKAAFSHARDDKKTERVLEILNRARSDLKAV